MVPWTASGGPTALHPSWHDGLKRTQGLVPGIPDKNANPDLLVRKLQINSAFYKIVCGFSRECANDTANVTKC